MIHLIWIISDFYNILMQDDISECCIPIIPTLQHRISRAICSLQVVGFFNSTIFSPQRVKKCPPWDTSTLQWRGAGGPVKCSILKTAKNTTP